MQIDVSCHPQINECGCISVYLKEWIVWDSILEVRKGAKITNQYNQVPNLTQDTNGKVKNSQLDSTSESQEVSPFQACDHRVKINRRVQRHNMHNTEKNIKGPKKKYRLGAVS